MLRIGQGWDIHRLVEGRPLRLGGITVPYDRGPLGHSDADVVIHAVCDALLGAAAAGDIGTHFPDSDARYKGIDSSELLARVIQIVAERGLALGNVDVTIFAERPRLAPHIAPMRLRLAEMLQLNTENVSIKAKTMEGLDAVGRGEAIAAAAVVLLEALKVGGL